MAALYAFNLSLEGTCCFFCPCRACKNALNESDDGRGGGDPPPPCGARGLAGRQKDRLSSPAHGFKIHSEPRE